MTEGVVYVGQKPVMNYVLATLTQFNEGAEKVVLKARGRAIGRAVDVAEIVRKRFLPNVDVESIKIDTDEIDSEQGRKVNVSTIEIVLIKKSA
ncbi:MAG: DNA-binding protein Alba [Archaeoglobales archaeon]|nr:MAG: DNA-binding protein Alba [Archaeoglobales archaeon]